MQGMKTDAATGRIIHWNCQQMICIDEHGGGHDEEGAYEDLRVAQFCNRAWHGEVQEQVSYGS